MSNKQYVYLATNGDVYEWSMYAVFATKAEAERYVELFAFADTVERWEVGAPDMPMDPEVKTWSCRYNGMHMTRKKGDPVELVCHEGALLHGHIGHVDGRRELNNLGTSVYARTAEEAYEKAKAIIDGKEQGT